MLSAVSSSLSFFSLPLSMLVVFAALTYTAAPAISLGANNTVRYFFGSK